MVATLHDGSEAIMVRFVWIFDGHAEVIGLFLGELGQLHANFLQVQAGDFFAELPGLSTGQDMDEMRREQARFEQERVVAFLGMDRDPHHRHVGAFERVHELGLFLRVEGDIRINAEDEKFLLLAALEEVVDILGACLGDQIEPLPGIHNAQVGVGVKALHELLTLMKHVGLDRVIHFVPAVRGFMADDHAPGPLAQCIG